MCLTRWKDNWMDITHQGLKLNLIGQIENDHFDWCLDAGSVQAVFLCCRLNGHHKVLSEIDFRLSDYLSKTHQAEFWEPDHASCHMEIGSSERTQKGFVISRCTGTSCWIPKKKYQVNILWIRCSLHQAGRLTQRYRGVWVIQDFELTGYSDYAYSD